MAKEKMDRSRQKDTFIKVLNYMKPYWFYLALSLVLAAVTVALTLYLPKLTGFAVDEIIEQGEGEFHGNPADFKADGGDHSDHGRRPVDHEHLQQQDDL